MTQTLFDFGIAATGAGRDGATLVYLRRHPARTMWRDVWLEITPTGATTVFGFDGFGELCQLTPKG